MAAQTRCWARLAGPSPGAARRCPMPRLAPCGAAPRTLTRAAPQHLRCQRHRREKMRDVGPRQGESRFVPSPCSPYRSTGPYRSGAGLGVSSARVHGRSPVMRWLVPLPFLCRDVHLQEGEGFICHAMMRKGERFICYGIMPRAGRPRCWVWFKGRSRCLSWVRLLRLVFKPVPVTQRPYLVCEWVSIACTSRRSGLLVLSPLPLHRVCADA